MQTHVAQQPDPRMLEQYKFLLQETATVKAHVYRAAVWLGFALGLVIGAAGALVSSNVEILAPFVVSIRVSPYLGALVPVLSLLTGLSLFAVLRVMVVDRQKQQAQLRMIELAFARLALALRQPQPHE